jgi:hypothetical protein
MNRLGHHTFEVALLLAVGCGSKGEDPQRTLEALRNESGSVTTAEFTTSTSLPSNPPPAVHVTVSDAAKAQALYAATLALPPVPPGEYGCPMDFGINYTLVFRDASSSTVMTTSLDPGGCQGVRMESPVGSTGAWTATERSYWSTLASDLGVAESAIYPWPR